VLNTGQRESVIVITRGGTATSDDYGGETSTPTVFARAYARVRFGTAQEKREAAQEAGSQAATFECVSNAKLRQVTLKDVIQFDGSDWDITEVAPLDRETIRFTATRSR
jgi:head-tail adaptor